MAASHSFLQYVGAGSRSGNLPQRMQYPDGIRLIVGFRRILLKFACPSHAWNWPRPLHGEKPDGFDAHQTCFKCSTERYYNTTMLQAGPLYRSLVPGTPQRTHGLVGSLRNWRRREDGPRGILRMTRIRRG